MTKAEYKLLPNEAFILKEGEIILISYDNTDYGSSSDDARLIFNLE